MKKTRLEKENIVKDLKQRLGEASAVFISGYRGLKVDEITELRKRLRAYNSEYRVIKNTLARLAVQGTPFEGLQRFVDGPVAITLSQGEPVDAAKVIKGFSTDFPKLELKGGLLGERLITAEDIERLSRLPSRDVLVGKLLGLFSVLPIRLVNVINAPLQRLTMALAAIQLRIKN